MEMIPEIKHRSNLDTSTLLNTNRMKLCILIASLAALFFMRCGNLIISHDGPELISSIGIETNDFVDTVYIFRTASNATVSDAILITMSPDLEFATYVFERFDSLISYEVGVDSLSLVLLDSEQKRKGVDTIRLAFSDLTN